MHRKSSKPRITIENETPWQTRDLRRFVVRAARDYGPRWSFTVRFYTARTDGSCGLAFIRGTFCQVGVTAPDRYAKRAQEYRRRAAVCDEHQSDVVRDYWRKKATSAEGRSLDKRQLAKVIAHELAHLRGDRHRKMRESYRELLYLGNWREKFSWADDLPLEPKPKAKKKPCATGLALAEERHAHCSKKLAEWEKKRKRADTATKKWRRKVRYYEKRMAALSANRRPHEPRANPRTRSGD